MLQSGDFQNDYRRILHSAEAETQLVKAEVKKPRSFHQSAKSTKTVSSMIVRGGSGSEQQRQQQAAAAAKKAAKKEGGNNPPSVFFCIIFLINVD